MQFTRVQKVSALLVFVEHLGSLENGLCTQLLMHYFLCSLEFRNESVSKGHGERGVKAADLSKAVRVPAAPPPSQGVLLFLRKLSGSPMVSGKFLVVCPRIASNLSVSKMSLK